ncbi:MAG: alpha/beta hydrolase [Alphaproteobacteria bacterium]
MADIPDFTPAPMPPPIPVTEGFVDAQGAKLWYWDTGGDGAPVVLGHSSTGSGLVWGYQQPVLAAAGYRVIGYSRRGHYGSESGPLRDRGTGAGDLKTLADQLELDRFHLLGTAMGGIVATDFAQAWPERLRSLLLACTLVGVTDSDYEAMSKGLRPDGFDRLPPEFRELGPSYRAANPEGVRGWLDLEHKALHGAPVSRQPTATKITWRTLENLPMPVLMLTGDADLYTPPAVLGMLAERIPRQETVIIPGAGHSAYWEQPAAFNGAMLGFLSRVEN